MTSSTIDASYLDSIRDLAGGRLTGFELISAAEAFKQAGRPDLAVHLYQLGIKCGVVQTVLHVAQFNLAMSLDASGDRAGAIAVLEEVLATSPDFQPARLNLGALLAAAGNINAALSQWQQAVVQMHPVNPTALHYKKMALRNIASYGEEARRYAEAETALAESLSLDGAQEDVMQKWLGLRQEQCIWPLVVPVGKLAPETMRRSMLPLSLAAFADDPLLQLAAGWNVCRTTSWAPSDTPLPPPPAPDAHERLRIGYLSSDLRTHAVGYLVPEVFEKHDRSRFEIFAYYNGPRSIDSISTRLRKAADVWVEIESLDDAQAAQRIIDDKIDILVDLNGHTRGARTGVLARRPAPIIVNWLGYPGTMGSPDHHYIIADEWIIPESHELYYSEKTLRLPCYQPNDTKRPDDTAPPSRQDAGLPEDAMVYCCFNSAHKITRPVFDRWMGILRQVPGSILWLLNSSDASTQRLIAAAAERGISADRMVFAARTSNPRHLARYPLADLFLDTFPYGAHTTGSDALWKGVPVLTLSGRCFASRVCGSLVRSAGVPELVCLTPEEYVAQAVELGTDRPRLARLKERLTSVRDSCTLFDMDGLVSHLEDLYLSMWDDWRNQRLPVPDLRNLDAYLDAGAQENFDQVDPIDLNDGDYHGRYRQRLTAIDRIRPLSADRRLWADTK